MIKKDIAVGIIIGGVTLLITILTYTFTVGMTLGTIESRLSSIEKNMATEADLHALEYRLTKDHALFSAAIRRLAVALRIDVVLPADQETKYGSHTFTLPTTIGSAFRENNSLVFGVAQATPILAGHPGDVSREIHIVALSGDAVYTTLLSPLAGNSPAGLLRADDLGPLVDGTKQVVDHPTAPRASDGTIYKYVTVASAKSPRFVQVGLPIEGSSPVSPRFSATP